LADEDMGSDPYFEQDLIGPLQMLDDLCGGLTGPLGVLPSEFTSYPGGYQQVKYVTLQVHGTLRKWRRHILDPATGQPFPPSWTEDSTFAPATLRARFWEYKVELAQLMGIFPAGRTRRRRTA